MADDLLEVVLAPDLLFEIELFLLELVLQHFDLVVRERVLNCDRDLARYFFKQLRVLLSESMRAGALDSEDAKHSIANDERRSTTGRHS